MRSKTSARWGVVFLAVAVSAVVAPAYAHAEQRGDKLPRDFAAELAAEAQPALHDVIVVLDAPEAADAFQQAVGRPLTRFRTLPMVRGFLSTSEIAKVIGRRDVRFVEPNRQLRLANDVSRLATGVEQVQTELGYTGKGVEVAIIDTGVDATHPDLRDSVKRNWVVTGACPKTCFDELAVAPTGYVGASPSQSALQVSVVDVSHDAGVAIISDTDGHGTHVAGSLAGTGAASRGRLRGVAPGADLHMYSTAIGDQILWFLEAFDHVIAQVQDRRADIRIISLSVVDISGCAFAPLGALSVASRTAVEAGILPVWAYGNYGAEPGTCSAAATAPYVLGVGASRGRGPVSSFSSRGLPNGNHDRERALANLEAFLAADESTRRMWDDEARPVGLFRPSLVAPGVDVISTQGPAGKYNTNSLEADPYYGRSSGTSMATPHVAGVVALVIQAHETNHPGQRLTPLDLIRLLEVTADRDHLIGALAFEGGAGLVDALEAVTLAAAGRIPPAVTSDHLLPETLGPADLRKTFRGSSPPQSRELNVGYTLVDIPVPDGVARLDIRIDAPAPAMLRLYPPGRNPDAAFVFLENVDWGTDSASVGAPWKGTWVLRVDNTGGPFTGIWEIRYAQPAAPPEHEPRVLGAPTPQTLPATGLSSSSSVVGALLLGAAVALRRIGRTPATRSGALRATSPSFPG